MDVADGLTLAEDDPEAVLEGVRDAVAVLDVVCDAEADVDGDPDEDGDADGVTDAVDDRDAEVDTDGVDVPVGDGEADCDAVLDGDGVRDDVDDEDEDPVPVALEVPDTEPVVLGECVLLPVPLKDGVWLGVRLEVCDCVAVTDGDLDGVGDNVGVSEADGVADGVQLGVAEADGVVDAVGLALAVWLPVPVGDAVGDAVGVLDDDGVGVTHVPLAMNTDTLCNPRDAVNGDVVRFAATLKDAVGAVCGSWTTTTWTVSSPLPTGWLVGSNGKPHWSPSDAAGNSGVPALPDVTSSAPSTATPKKSDVACHTSTASTVYSTRSRLCDGNVMVVSMVALAPNAA